MEILSQLVAGTAILTEPASLLAAFLGLSAGIVVGALPGLTATMAVAVLAPFTFFMSTTIGIPFLLGVYKGAIYGGSIPAILINTPGTAAAAATAMDGHVLARRGEARKALEVSLYASVVADMLATLVLIGVAAPLAAAALRFSSPEFTLLFLLSLTMVAAVSGESLLKGLQSAALGALLACIGLDPMSGALRFTFGSVNLMGSINLVPLMIGMFAVSEILIRAADGATHQPVAASGGPRLSLGEARAVGPAVLRSSAVGIFLGTLPGLGAEISCWISYGLARRRSRHPERFGKGSLEGVAAAEAGNNAVCPAALIPMMVFGIPGDTITAVLIGAFMAQGLLPGPLLFQQHGPVLYGLFVLMLITNLMLLLAGLLAIRYLGRIAALPPGNLYPIVTVFCVAGAFAVNSSVFDIWVMMAGGLLGYGMRRAGVPIPPLVISMLLASPLENALRQSLILSNNDLTIFFTRPIAGVLSGLLVMVLLGLLWRTFRAGRQSASKLQSYR